MNTASTLLVIATLVCSGCTYPPYPLSYHAPVAGPVAAMKVDDTRVVKFEVKLSPPPDPKTYLLGTYVLCDGQRCADLVAQTIATRYPEASIVLREFTFENEGGIITNRIRLRIVVDIRRPPAPSFTITANGERTYQVRIGTATTDAIDYALADLRAKL